MVETGDHRLSNDPAEPLAGAADRRILPESQIRAGTIVVAGICGHDPAKMRLVKHDHMVEALPLQQTDQSPDIGVLPGRMWGDGSIPDAKATQTSLHDLAIDAVTVSHEIFWCFIPGKRIGNLPSDPFRRGMRRHRIVNELPTAVPRTIMRRMRKTTAGR